MNFSSIVAMIIRRIVLHFSSLTPFSNWASLFSFSISFFRFFKRVFFASSRSEPTNAERQAGRFLSTFALASSAYLFTAGFRCGLRHNKPYAYIYGLFPRVIFKPRRSARCGALFLALIRACHADAHARRVPDASSPRGCTWAPPRITCIAPFLLIIRKDLTFYLYILLLSTLYFA